MPSVQASQMLLAAHKVAPLSTHCSTYSIEGLVADSRAVSRSKLLRLSYHNVSGIGWVRIASWDEGRFSFKDLESDAKDPASYSASPSANHSINGISPTTCTASRRYRCFAKVHVPPPTSLEIDF